MITQVTAPAILEMTISTELEENFKGSPYFLEIEMLQGKREVCPDGRIRYELEIEDPDKVDLVRQFILRLMTSGIREVQN